MAYVIHDRSFTQDRANVNAFSEQVAGALTQLENGLNKVVASWTDTEDPKGTELKTSMESLKTTAKDAQGRLVEQVGTLLDNIKTASTNING